MHFGAFLLLYQHWGKTLGLGLRLYGQSAMIVTNERNVDENANKGRDVMDERKCIVRLSTVIIRVCDIRIRRNQLQTLFVFLGCESDEKYFGENLTYGRNYSTFCSETSPGPEPIRSAKLKLESASIT